MQTGSSSQTDRIALISDEIDSRIDQLLPDWTGHPGGRIANGLGWCNLIDATGKPTSVYYDRAARRWYRHSTDEGGGGFQLFNTHHGYPLYPKGVPCAQAIEHAMLVLGIAGELSEGQIERARMREDEALAAAKDADADLAQRRTEKVARAATLWEASDPLCTDPPDKAVRRLRARGITRIPANARLYHANRIMPGTRGYRELDVDALVYQATTTADGLVAVNYEPLRDKPHPNPDNPKRFTFGATRGAWIENRAFEGSASKLPENSIILAEGQFTALTVWQIFGVRTLATMSAGNFEACCERLQKYQKRVYLVSDRDPRTPGPDGGEDGGFRGLRKGAVVLANAGVDAYVVEPSEPDGSGRDCNDTLMRANGGEAVIAQDFENAVPVAKWLQANPLASRKLRCDPPATPCALIGSVNPQINQSNAATGGATVAFGPTENGQECSMSSDMREGHWPQPANGPQTWHHDLEKGPALSMGVFPDNPNRRGGLEAPQYGPPPPPQAGDPGPGPKLQQVPQAPQLLDLVAFVNGYQASTDIVDEVMARGYVYSFTGRTGHGKTATAVYLAFAVAYGLPFCGKQTEQAQVVYLAGENPHDVRARCIAFSEANDIEIEPGRITLMDGARYDITTPLGTAALAREIENLGDVGLIIIDTLAAYYRGDDDSRNMQILTFPRDVMRPLSLLKSNPTVIALAHPTKHAGKQELTPRGGGAFEAEVDGNFTQWYEDDIATFHHGKLRGDPFEPLELKFERHESPRFINQKGKQKASIYARHISGSERAKANKIAQTKENQILYDIAHNPDQNSAKRAKNLGLSSSTLSRQLQKMSVEKWVEKHGRNYVITAKGKKVIEGFDPHARTENWTPNPDEFDTDKNRNDG